MSYEQKFTALGLSLQGIPGEILVVKILYIYISSSYENARRRNLFWFFCLFLFLFVLFFLSLTFPVIFVQLSVILSVAWLLILKTSSFFVKAFLR